MAQLPLAVCPCLASAFRRERKAGQLRPSALLHLFHWKARNSSNESSRDEVKPRLSSCSVAFSKTLNVWAYSSDTPVNKFVRHLSERLSFGCLVPRAITGNASLGRSPSDNTSSEFLMPLCEPTTRGQRNRLYIVKGNGKKTKLKNPSCSIYMLASAFEFFNTLQRYQSWKKQHFTTSFSTSSSRLGPD